MKSLSVRLIIFSLFFSSLTKSNVADSLKLILLCRSSDSSKLKAYHHLSWTYMATIPDSARYFSNQGISFSRFKKNNSYLGKFYNNCGVSFLYQSIFDSAAFYFRRAEQYHRQNKNKKDLALVINNLGVVEYYLGKLAPLIFVLR